MSVPGGQHWPVHGLCLGETFIEIACETIAYDFLPKVDSSMPKLFTHPKTGQDALGLLVPSGQYWPVPGRVLH